MAKIAPVLVEGCEKCPFSYVEGSADRLLIKCHLTGKKISRWEIPDWCPLPDAEEGDDDLPTPGTFLKD